MDNKLSETIRGVWERYPDEEYRKDQSHWRGFGRWKDDARWQAIGQKSVANINLILQHLGHGPDTWTSPKRILEWGPGGGANLFAFRHVASKYYGVDISQKNLSECTRLSTEENAPIFSPILLGDQPSDIVEKVDPPADIFLSTAVFQHFPSKEYGAAVLETLYNVTRANAIGFVQIRYDDGTEKFKPISNVGEYHERHITANSYQLNEFWDLCESSGFKVLFISDIRSVNNYATFNLIRTRQKP